MIHTQGRGGKYRGVGYKKRFRWVTAACMLDYSTCVIADKFGSVSVIRLPTDTNEDTQVANQRFGLD